jgi:hypothetical protein
MSKKHGRWYGRPHEPPKNWHMPEKPAIRKVTGSFDDLPFQPAPKDETGLVAITLTNGHWVAILKALQLYGETHGDADWQHWRLGVRSEILGTVNANRDDGQPVAVKLSLDDWRNIWQQVCTVCQQQGEEWASWFGWLSATMTKQIKDGTT